MSGEEAEFAEDKNGEEAEFVEDDISFDFAHDWSSESQHSDGDFSVSLIASMSQSTSFINQCLETYRQMRDERLAQNDRNIDADPDTAARRDLIEQVMEFTSTEKQDQLRDWVNSRYRGKW